MTPATFAVGRDAAANGEDIDYHGASGKVDLDDNGDVIGGTYAIWKIAEEGGTLQYVNQEIIAVP